MEDRDERMERELERARRNARRLAQMKAAVAQATSERPRRAETPVTAVVRPTWVRG